MADGVYLIAGEALKHCSSCGEHKPEHEFDWRADATRTKTCSACLQRKRWLKNTARPRTFVTAKALELPERHHKWTRVSTEPFHFTHPNGHTEFMIRARCDCGHERNFGVCYWRRGCGKISRSCIGCREYGASQRRYANVGRIVDSRDTHPGRTELQRSRDESSWRADKDAQDFVASHPEGATLEEVGDYFGLTRERIRQIESSALRKLRLGDNGEGRLRNLHRALAEREQGARDRGALRNGSTLTWDELPTLDGSHD